MQLAGWETFYVIIGSSSAALIGLQFVVIALSADRRKVTPTDEMTVRAFGTPTIIHFSVVLLLAAFMTIPGQTVFSLHLCVMAAAIFGLIYVVRAFVLARRQQAYKPVAEDWIWHVVLPLAAYLHLVLSGFALAHSEGSALYAVAATTLALLYIGIHNAWDSAVYRDRRGAGRRSESDGRHDVRVLVADVLETRPDAFLVEVTDRVPAQQREFVRARQLIPQNLQPNRAF